MKKLFLIIAVLLFTGSAHAERITATPLTLNNITGVLSVDHGGTSGTGAIRTATTDDTLVIGDSGNLVELNSSSAITITVPPNSSVAFPVGVQINVFQYGSGAASIVAGSGVTIRKLSSLNFVGQWSRVVLTKIGSDEWLADGALQ